LKAYAALHYTRGKGYYEQFREDDDLLAYNLPPVTIGNVTIESTDIIRRRWLDNGFYGTVFSLNYLSKNGEWDVILGGGANRYDGDHFGEIIWARTAGNTDIREPYYDNVAVKDDRNLYLKATHEVAERLYLFGDIQYRNIEYTFSGINHDLRDITGKENYNFFNPKFGLTYENGNGNTWYASYAVANREPVRKDFTDNPITEVPRPEKLNNIEAGIRAQSGQFSYNANFYYMDYTDQLILTGQINNVGGYMRENVANSYRAGIELDGSIQLSPNFGMGGNIAFSRNKIDVFTEYVDDYSEGFSQEVFTYENTDIAFSPNIVGSAMVDYRPVNNLEISILSKYVDEQYLDNSQRDDRKLEAYFVNDLRLRYSVQPKFIKAMEFSLLVNNIFNQFYEPNGYTFSYYLPGEVSGSRELITENYYYPMAGTNFMAGVNIEF
jgi:iron complex outermembrane receptor protein